MLDAGEESGTIPVRQQLIEGLINAVKQGRGVVPLIGSGMSAGSGIPSGSDYRAYLFHCLKRVLTPEVGTPAWNPRTLLWPPFSEVTKHRTADDLSRRMLMWSNGILTDLLSEADVAPRRQGVADRRKRARPVPRDHRDARWQAAGVVADWRATLHFLSRVVPEGHGSQRLGLRDTDPRVIDSFFVNLTEGKLPNAAHALLPHLVDFLRVEVLLTTNFDTLIEAAFGRQDMPLVTFDVHYDAGLPHERLVRARRSLVKLHGGRYGLRADFSLDQHPQQHDIDNFCAYVAPHFDDGTEREAKSSIRNPRDLLVMGVSGEDRRTIGLICHAAYRSKGLKVHWICHEEAEVDGVRQAFEEGKREVSRWGEGHGIRPPDLQVESWHSWFPIIAAAPDLTLFLLELFQHIFLCVPPSRVGFPAVWPSPPSPLRALVKGPVGDSENPIALRVRDSRRQIEKKRAEPNQPLAPPSSDSQLSDAKVFVVHGPPGASSVASQAFSELVGGFHAVWLNLDERFNDVDFRFLLLASLAREAGIPAPFPLERVAVNGPDYAVHLNTLVARAGRPFVVFVNARDLPTSKLNLGQFEGLPEIVLQLGKEDDISVVVICWGSPQHGSTRLDEGTHQDEETSFLDWLLARLKREHSTGRLVEAMETQNFGIETAAAIVAKSIADPPGGDPRFTHFLLGLTLFRHPCHLSALHSWALLRSLTDEERKKLEERPEDNDDERSRTAAQFLERLRTAKIIRDDQGNNVFMYRDYRDLLREQIRAKLGHRALRDFAEAHQGVADWYIKLYRSSGDIHAAFECVYHRIESAVEALKLPANDRDRSFFIDSAAVEIGVTLDLLAADIDTSTRPMSLLHLWQELITRMQQLREREPSNTKLGIDLAELQRMKEAYLADVGEGPDPELKGVGRETERSGEKVPSDRDLRAPHFLLWTRHYDGAARALERILVMLENPANKNEDAVSTLREFFVGQTSGDQLRREARGWANGHSGAWVTAAVRTLRRYHLLKLYESEAARLLANTGRGEQVKEVADQRLVEAERIYLFSAELTRFMDNTGVLQGENALFRSQHGILLSWRGRYREARRRYVEAYGYLSYVTGPSRPVRWATVDLRRTETFLCELQNRQGLSSDERCGLIYDAVAGIERASYKTRETAVNIRWYGWLREVELAVCVEIARLENETDHRRFARCRDREGLDEWCAETIENGRYRVSTDPLRLPRFVELGMEFLSARKRDDTQATSTQQRIVKLLNEMIDLLQFKGEAAGKKSDDAISRDVVAYSDAVRMRAEKVLRELKRNPSGTADGCSNGSGSTEN